MYRMLATLTVILGLAGASFAADMVVQPQRSTNSIESGKQYYTTLNCQFRVNEIQFRKSALKYMRDIDKNGDPTGKGLFQAKEIFHGLMIFKNKPAIDKEKFAKGEYQAPADSFFIPLFYIKREGVWPKDIIKTAKYFRNSCPEALYMIGENEYYFVPVFMYSNESTESTPSFLSALIGLVSDIANPLHILFGQQLPENAQTKLTNLQTVVQKIEEFAAGPKVKVAIDDPIRFREGATTIITRYTNVLITTKRQKSFLRGGNGYRKDQSELFQARVTVGKLGTPNEIIESCNTWDIALKGLGLRDEESRFDRSYIMFREMVARRKNELDVIRCLRAPEDNLVLAATDPRIQRIFYYDRDFRISKEDIRKYERSHPEELGRLPLPPKLPWSEPETDRQFRYLDEVLTVFLPNVARAESRERLNSNARNIEREYFTPVIHTRELVANEVWTVDNFNDGVLTNAPFETVKALIHNGFTKADCLIKRDSITDAVSRGLVLGEAPFGFLIFKQEDPSAQSRLTDAVAARVVYADDGDQYRITGFEMFKARTGIIAAASGCNLASPN